MVKQYRPERYFLYYIYISQTELEITEDEKNRYSNLLFWDPETLSYFKWTICSRGWSSASRIALR